MNMIQLRILTQGRLSGMIWVALTATTSDLTREGQREMRPSGVTGDVTTKAGITAIWPQARGPMPVATRSLGEARNRFSPGAPSLPMP